MASTAAPDLATHSDELPTTYLAELAASANELATVTDELTTSANELAPWLTPILERDAFPSNHRTRKEGFQEPNSAGNNNRLASISGIAREADEDYGVEYPNSRSDIGQPLTPGHQ